MLILQEQAERTWSFGYQQRNRVEPAFFMDNRILLVTNYGDSTWSELMASMIVQFGVPELIRYEHIYEVLHQWNIVGVILDDDPSVDILRLVAHIRDIYPSVPILIGANSVSWNRARKLFVAGASDYFYATLDEAEMLHTLQVNLGNAGGEEHFRT